MQREWWYHRFGCEVWFLAERDTRTNEVLKTELPPAVRTRRDARSRSAVDPVAAGRLMRLPPQPRERIDRSEKVVFYFDGKPVEAFAGDTIGSALFASGRRIFSRSFKYHRRAGSSAAPDPAPNCMMQVDGVPNVRVCTEPVRSGMRVEAAERSRLARARSALGHGQVRRAVHAGRLLLPDDDPAPAGLAAVREVPAQRGRPREARQALATASSATTSSTGEPECS